MPKSITSKQHANTMENGCKGIQKDVKSMYNRGVQKGKRTIMKTMKNLLHLCGMRDACLCGMKNIRLESLEPHETGGKRGDGGGEVQGL